MLLHNEPWGHNTAYHGVNMMMMMMAIIIIISAVAMTMKNTTIILLISLTLNIKSKRVIFHLPN